MSPASDAGWLDAMHLASASLPIGGFAYSQGLEQACESGLVRDVTSAQRWIDDYLVLVIARQELPWWNAIYEAATASNWDAVVTLTKSLSALREAAELRLESTQMAHAMVNLFDQWLGSDAQLSIPETVTLSVANDYTAAHAALCAAKQLAAPIGMSAWVWSWLDNQVLAAVKLVPLGQRHGQQIMHSLKARVPDVVDQALQTPLNEAGSAAIGLMMASARHETQYARLFRS